MSGPSNWLRWARVIMFVLRFLDDMLHGSDITPPNDEPETGGQ